MNTRTLCETPVKIIFKGMIDLTRRRQPKKPVSIGDVFAIPLSANQYAYGQVVGEGNPKTYVIYDITANQHPSLHEVTSKKIIFFTHTVDVPIEDGDWILLGNVMIPDNIRFPEYIVDTLKGYYVTSYMGDVLRPANDYERANLGTRKSVSPSILEDAVKAQYGYETWYTYLDKLKYSF
ncbi:Imm26 family immunity protein [Cohnella yongneupensis]|uniref:Imm26 family immunity protein n=1 Tax=Cohnella yongneupensis TaxID=425006 RepID=A0ABW0QTC0_9BACL